MSHPLKPADFALVVQRIAGAIVELRAPGRGGHAITDHQAIECAAGIATALLPLFQDAIDTGYAEAAEALSGRIAAFSAAHVAGATQ